MDGGAGHDRRSVRLPDGERVPALGQGTWRMGESADARADELAALRLGLDLGLTVLDTAEVYAEGGAERLVGDAMAGRRDAVFLVGKVTPDNAAGERLRSACEASLRRLRTDRIDLYLLHWRGAGDLARTVEGMEALKDAGRIRQWGVSNFDVGDMEALVAAGGAGCAANQVYYSLSSRGPEYALAPWLAARSMPLMAYSPVEKGRLLDRPELRALALALDATPAQIALAWTLRGGEVIALPKASRAGHVRENAAAGALELDARSLAVLDAAFTTPTRAEPLRLLLS